MRIAIAVVLILMGAAVFVAPFLKNHEACSPEQEDPK